MTCSTATATSCVRSLAFWPIVVCALSLDWVLAAGCAWCAPPECCEVQVIDRATRRGVPLVELVSVDQQRFYTDSAGRVAIDDPALVGRECFFTIQSDGYRYPADGFGFHGAKVTLDSRHPVTLEIDRLQIAERLYRVTGAGIYDHTVRLGKTAPIAEPMLNSQVAGCDSVQTAFYRDRLHWYWGDTNRLLYPLGNFHVTGATSRMPRANSGKGTSSEDRDAGEQKDAEETAAGLDADVGVDFRYWTGDDGFARSMARMEGDGPTWIDGLVVVPDATGRERLLAGYYKVRQGLDIYRRGIVEFDDEQEQFTHRADSPLDSPALPFGHALLHTEGDQRYVYFGNPFPLTRVPAQAEQIANRDAYECFTPVLASAKVSSKSLDQGNIAADQLDRVKGRLNYQWRRGGWPLSPAAEAALRRKKLLAQDEGMVLVVDFKSRRPVRAHSGSVAWNAYRNRWIAIFVEAGGSSNLGEVWYSEADRPQGPWKFAHKVATHTKYSFYNPLYHACFDQNDGRTIFFEGTYTTTFSGNDRPTPRYDYNQLMYRLDLSDERLKLPAGDQ